MAVKSVVQTICDRCEKVVDETGVSGSSPSEPATNHALVYVEGKLLVEAKRIHFVDLCSKCVVRVQSLLSQIRLDEAVKGGDGKPAVVDNTPAASTQKPTTQKADKSVATKA